MMKTCLPIDYITHQNICPGLLCKIFLPFGHLLFVMNNPPLSPIIWEINNIVTLHRIFSAIGCFREPYVYFISSIFFKGIRQRLNVTIHFMFLPTAIIRVITYLTIFLSHCLQHVISHSINHILIWNLGLCFICTLCSGLYQINNIIVIRSIDK